MKVVGRCKEEGEGESEASLKGVSGARQQVCILTINPSMPTCSMLLAIGPLQKIYHRQIQQSLGADCTGPNLLPCLLLHLHRN